jgi:tryptophan synthase beta chain
MDIVKYILTEKQMPTGWYNIQADLPQVLPPVLYPGTGEQITADDLFPFFPAALT